MEEEASTTTETAEKSSTATTGDLPPEKNNLSSAEEKSSSATGANKKGGKDEKKLYRVIFLIGPPCAGKSTLCRDISDERYRVISCRELISRIAESDGNEKTGASESLNKGIMFDPTFVTRLIADEIKKAVDDRTVVIDGFPRVRENLTACFREVEGIAGDYVGTVLLDCPPEECVRRSGTTLVLFS